MVGRSSGVGQMHCSAICRMESTRSCDTSTKQWGSTSSSIRLLLMQDVACNTPSNEIRLVFQPFNIEGLWLHRVRLCLVAGSISNYLTKLIGTNFLGTSNDSWSQYLREWTSIQLIQKTKFNFEVRYSSHSTWGDFHSSCQTRSISWYLQQVQQSLTITWTSWPGQIFWPTFSERS